MHTFINENFLLSNPTAQRLYYDYAAQLPIVDYHNHLPPDKISEAYCFKSITEAWLAGDHYKWRAMRTNGVSEFYCTGAASDFDKFQQWAATVPYTLRNPLYHWTHLELLRYFDISELLDSTSARKIYDTCNEKLQQPSFNTIGLLKAQNVRLLCTTDDPLDKLEQHASMQHRDTGITMLPAFRPDRAMAVEKPAEFLLYLKELEGVSNISINNYDDYLSALLLRHDYFASLGCTVADHGLEYMYAAEYKLNDIKETFQKIRQGMSLQPMEIIQFKSSLLYEFACWHHAKGWVQQYHLGALRGVNTRQVKTLGADTGWDSIADYPQALSCAKFLNRLDAEGKLAKTILYNLNPADNEVMASMIGNFNDGSVAAKLQWGSAWWFLDQKDGMTRQLNTLSNMGLVSRFIGMLTDSRSFLSFPRHEYFRRILCNLFGKEIEDGELPNDEKLVGSIIGDICYHNSVRYFNWQDYLVTASKIK